MRKGRLSFRKNRRGVSPAISTVILTTAIIVMILVAMEYANSMLNTQMANNEFTSNQQFMQTTGQQMDAVAWTLGGTQTVTYSTKFGSLDFNASALEYSFSVTSSSGPVQPITQSTGVILYNIPVSSVSMGNGYFERVPVNANSSFVQMGASAPVSQVFCEETLSNTSAYTRIVMAPTIRVLNSTIMGAQPTSYYKIYLPYLDDFSTTLSSAPSVTLTGQNVTEVTYSGVTKISITAIPNVSGGFNSSFFNFANTTVTLNIPSSFVEIYFGGAQVTEGCST